MEEDRKLEVLIENSWVEFEKMEDIKKDMKFRLFESNNEIVTDKNGKNEFIAKNDAYFNNKFGVFCVDVKEGVE